jgi:23S rRNA (cytosine1962-C5)-methyltransferase
MTPCVLFEDEHLLVVNKPAGMNTHAPSPFAGEGIYDWLRHREPRWADLAIIHRLDKETSGVIVFSKTALANRSLTEQFTQRTVRKKYLLLTDRPLKQSGLVVKSKIVRVGERYASGAHGEPAETRFKISVAADVKRLHLKGLNGNEPSHVGCYEIEAEPLTGRTHQIRVHAAENGFPILGDTLYGGSTFSRVCLHAAEITLRHPGSGEAMTFRSPADFSADARLALRQAAIDTQETNAFRLIHGASDGWPGWYVERLGNFLLSQSERELNTEQRQFLDPVMADDSRITHHASRITAAYHKILNRQVRQAALAETSPQHLLGETAPERFVIRENGVQFELSFNEGYSVGLFLDQRDNRRRFLTGHVAADFPLCNSKFKIQNSKFQVLNTFAYTCGFSVCAAKAGAQVTSLDLSKKYLEWGKRNFALNSLEPAGHDFIFGDAFDWLRRLAKKERKFDAIVLEPPTFSQSKECGAFRVEKDFGKLVAAALPLLRPGGVLFASTNASAWPPEIFLASVEDAIQSARRKILQRHYVPQPPDFPVSRTEPAYLKTVWMRVA